MKLIHVHVFSPGEWAWAHDRSSRWVHIVREACVDESVTACGRVLVRPVPLGMSWREPEPFSYCTRCQRIMRAAAKALH